MKQKKKTRAKVTQKQTHRIRRRGKTELQRVVEYFISGGVWFWSGYILIVTLDDPLSKLWGEQKGLFVANFIGNAVGISLNFLLERYWVFKTKRAAKLAIAAKRYIIYTFLNAFVLNYFILLGLQDILGIKPEIGQFIASGFFTIWNYIWYKQWVFKGMERPRRSRHHA